MNPTTDDAPQGFRVWTKDQRGRWKTVKYCRTRDHAEAEARNRPWEECWITPFDRRPGPTDEPVRFGRLFLWASELCR